jgi:hypothetical protein
VGCGGGGGEGGGGGGGARVGEMRWVAGCARPRVGVEDDEEEGG